MGAHDTLLVQRRHVRTSDDRFKKNILLQDTSQDKKDAIDIVLSAYRSLRSHEGFIYLSMPITSGCRRYDVLDRHGVKSIETLRQIDPKLIYEEIIKPNVQENTQLANRLALEREKTLIAPGIFEAKKQRWAEAEYMYLWYHVMEELVDETIMTDGWQYSNGGTQEFVWATELKFGYHLKSNGPTFLGFPMYTAPMFSPELYGSEEIIQFEDTMLITDQRDRCLDIGEGTQMISRAIVDLKDRGFDPTSLERSLLELGGIAENYEKYRPQYAAHGVEPPYEPDTQAVFKAIEQAGIKTI